MTKFEQFKSLHHQASPLLIANVWDANSAKIFEELGFKAVATSSAALANTFGFADGEQLPFDLLLAMVRCIVQKLNIPVSVDMEGGYGRSAPEIANNIEQLVAAGAVGINLEDSVPGQQRTIHEATGFATQLAAIKSAVHKKSLNVFINIRTDVFLLALPNANEEARKRIQLYQQAGADGIFLPCIVSAGDIEAAVQAAHIPVGVMAMPDLPSFAKLQQLGVKRISMGTALHKYINEKLRNAVGQLNTDGSFRSIF